MQSKKQLILWVLNILSNESDEENPLTQTKIADIISAVYPCERKTVCRNIKFLQEMGYPIKKTGKGFYLEGKVFSVEEVAFVQKAILRATGKGEEEKNELAEKVADSLNKTYRRRIEE